MTLILAVELAQTGECDVADAEIQAHADGVGRDQVVDLAGLVERDLGVARPRRERPEHDCGAAPPVPQTFREAVHLGDAEGHDRAARGQRAEPA